MFLFRWGAGGISADKSSHPLALKELAVISFSVSVSSVLSLTTAPGVVILASSSCSRLNLLLEVTFEKTINKMLNIAIAETSRMMYESI